MIDDNKVTAQLRSALADAAKVDIPRSDQIVHKIGQATKVAHRRQRQRVALKISAVVVAVGLLTGGIGIIKSHSTEQQASAKRISAPEALPLTNSTVEATTGKTKAVSVPNTEGIPSGKVDPTSTSGPPSPDLFTDPNSPTTLFYSSAGLTSKPYTGSMTKIDQKAAIDAVDRQMSDPDSLGIPLAALRNISISSELGEVGQPTPPISDKEAWILIFNNQVPDIHVPAGMSSDDAQKLRDSVSCNLLTAVDANDGAVLLLTQVCDPK